MAKINGESACSSLVGAFIRPVCGTKHISISSECASSFIRLYSEFIELNAEKF